MKNIRKYLLAALSAGFISLTMYAQPGVIAIREADAPDKKLLTMEDAILGYHLYPETRSYRWRPGTSMLTFMDGSGIKGLNPLENTDLTIVSNETLEEITGAGNFSSYRWLSENTLALMSGDRICMADISNGRLCGSFNIPEGAENFTFNKAGFNVFTIDNGLYFCDNKGNWYPIATDSDPDIIYGSTVSRNEFGIEGGIFLSGSGKKLAFYRKDESAVGTFPLLDINSRTGRLFEIKYPMAGMSSENVRLGIFDFSSNETVYVQADDFGYDQYLTNITWSPDDRYIFIHVLDRSQKNMHLNMYNAADGEFVRTILTESNASFVEPLDPIRFIEGSDTEFIYRTDNRDGFKNLYLCNLDGKITRLTKTDADVAYVGNNGRKVFYTSAEISPVENHLFSIDIRSGKKMQLTGAAGWHNVSLSPDCRYFLDQYSSLNVPKVIDITSTTDKKSANLLTAEDPVKDYAFGEITLGKIKSADGKFDNYYRLIKPLGFDPSRKYPVIVYVYGGPHSQLVRNSWLASMGRWEMLMAQKGYLVYVQDNRGTQNRGAEFEKVIYGQCGQAEMADQMEGVRMLMDLPYVDKDRIGVHGWSYGGFMTISLTTNYPDIFKVAVAGGPVIDWKWYEVMYGERYMGNPATNPDGYEKVSLIGKAKDLRSRLLICQGAVDNVVVWEHSLSFIRECIKNHIQVDYFPYPCAQHNVLGKDRIHLMDKVTLYFEDFLK